MFFFKLYKDLKKQMMIIAGMCNSIMRLVVSIVVIKNVTSQCHYSYSKPFVLLM